jgi:hypothetical protein
MSILLEQLLLCALKYHNFPNRDHIIIYVDYPFVQVCGGQPYVNPSPTQSASYNPSATPINLCSWSCGNCHYFSYALFRKEEERRTA